MDQAKRLKQLETENTRLRRAVSDLILDNQILKGVVCGKLMSPSRRRLWAERVSQTYRVSERRACQVLSQPRATQRWGQVR